MSADPFLAQLADRIGEKVVGIRKPKVKSTEVRTSGSGAVTVVFHTEQGVVEAELRWDGPAS